MKFRIQSRGFKLTKALYNRVSLKLHRILSRYDDRITSAEVTLQDVNGPKGGEDMQCLVNIKLSKSKSIVVQERATDLYDAINTCSQRVRLTMERHFERTRQMSRRKNPLAISAVGDESML